MKPSIVELPGKGNYALILPNTIEFGLDVSSKEELISWINDIEESWTASDQIDNPNLKSEIGLIVTFDCNLGCIYCYARGGESRETMLFTTATEAINFVHEKEGRDCLIINLVGGGEPLLNLDLVRDIVEYAKSVFKSVEVNVVTNTTFGKKTLDWILTNKIVVRSSYDGEMQDKQRPYRNGSSCKKTVVENIRNLVAENNPLTVSCIVTENGVNTLRKTIDEMVDIGVGAIEFEVARKTSVSRNSGWNEPNPFKFADALLDVIGYAANMNGKIQVSTSYFSVPRVGGNYCGVSGKNRIITPSGLVTSCLDVSRVNDPYAEKLIFGDTILKSSENKAFLENFENLSARGCFGCNLQMICQGGCPMAGLWEHGLPVRKSMYTCTFEHYFLPKLLLAMAENPDVVTVLTGESEFKC